MLAIRQLSDCTWSNTCKFAAAPQPLQLQALNAYSSNEALLLWATRINREASCQLLVYTQVPLGFGNAALRVWAEPVPVMK